MMDATVQDIAGKLHRSTQQTNDGRDQTLAELHEAVLMRAAEFVAQQEVAPSSIDRLRNAYTKLAWCLYTGDKKLKRGSDINGFDEEDFSDLIDIPDTPVTPATTASTTVLSDMTSSTTFTSTNHSTVTSMSQALSVSSSPDDDLNSSKQTMTELTCSEISSSAESSICSIPSTPSMSPRTPAFNISPPTNFSNASFMQPQSTNVAQQIFEQISKQTAVASHLMRAVLGVRETKQQQRQRQQQTASSPASVVSPRSNAQSGLAMLSKLEAKPSSTTSTTSASNDNVHISKDIIQRDPVPKRIPTDRRCDHPQTHITRLI